MVDGRRPISLVRVPPGLLILAAVFAIGHTHPSQIFLFLIPMPAARIQPKDEIHLFRLISIQVSQKHMILPFIIHVFRITP